MVRDIGYMCRLSSMETPATKQCSVRLHSRDSINRWNVTLYSYTKNESSTSSTDVRDGIHLCDS
eukprot:15496808-Heterocapsa_arctica.AAC.2